MLRRFSFNTWHPPVLGSNSKYSHSDSGQFSSLLQASHFFWQCAKLWSEALWIANPCKSNPPLAPSSLSASIVRSHVDEYSVMIAATRVSSNVRMTSFSASMTSSMDSKTSPTSSSSIISSSVRGSTVPFLGALPSCRTHSSNSSPFKQFSEIVLVKAAVPPPITIWPSSSMVGSSASNTDLSPATSKTPPMTRPSSLLEPSSVDFVTSLAPSAIVILPPDATFKSPSHEIWVPQPPILTVAPCCISMALPLAT